MDQSPIITTLFGRIINAKSIKELKLLKKQLEEAARNFDEYQYTDLMILSLAIEFRAYTFIVDKDNGKDIEKDDIQELYEKEINIINKRSLERVT